MSEPGEDPYSARSEFECKLVEYIQSHALAVEHLRFNQSCHSVAQAALAANAREDEFVKSICMVLDDGRLAVAIVKGEDRASYSLVAAALGARKARPATPDEMLAQTGYPAGGTPPFGFNAAFLLDERVVEAPRVFAGGGSDRALISTTPAELIRANGGTVAKIRK